MGSKKKRGHSKSRKKHKHKKHKIKKHKLDISDAHGSSDFEATASTQEALEQYDRILLALESSDVPQAAGAVVSIDVSSAESRRGAQEEHPPPEQPSNVKKSNEQASGEDKKLVSKEKIRSSSKDDSQGIDSHLQDKRTKNQSRNRDCQSKGRKHQSKSRSHRSRSKNHRSRSKNHQSRSRERQSRNRSNQSRSKGYRYRSCSRDHKSRSSGHRSRRRHHRSSSSISSHGRSRSHERKRGRRRRSSSSRSSQSRSPKRKSKIIVEKVKPPQGSLESFTTLCQQIAAQVQELPDINFPVDDTVTQQQPIRAPFNLGTANSQNLVFHNNAWKTSMQVMAEKVTTSSVTEIFPCSSGTDHHAKEVQETTVGPQTLAQPDPPQEPIDIGALSQRRLQLQQQLQANPMDIQAYSSYLQVEQQIAEWSNAQKVPGQFTGQKKPTVLLGKDLHATGRQAWVKKDMFARLDPVKSDFGIKMMKKMGWVEGTPLGKAGVGHIVPPVLNFQVDRKGLLTEVDSVKVAPPPNSIKCNSRNTPFMFKGKHPVSALQELAAKKQWIVSYEDVAIPDKLGFCYKVTLPLGTFQPTDVSSTKKQAKVHAALNCLVGIGALPAQEAKSILESQGLT